MLYMGDTMENNNNLLIVEDEKAFRMLLTAFFRRLNYFVIAVESAEEALEKVEKECCNIGIVDLKLPGMSGVELVKVLKKKNPVGIFYAITGFSSLFELAETREAGFDDYFCKPLKLHELQHAVEEAEKRIERWQRRI